MSYGCACITALAYPPSCGVDHRVISTGSTGFWCAPDTRSAALQLGGGENVQADMIRNLRS
jgi:hypothetical protein